MVFAEFASHVRHPASRRDGQRRGQYAFSLLDKIHPHLAAQIVGTDLDPFHQDDLIEPFLAYCQEHWNR